MFLHYAFDAWMSREFGDVRFERSCDDVVVHAASERHARMLRPSLSTSGETLTIEESMTLRARTENA